MPDAEWNKSIELALKMTNLSTYSVYLSLNAYPGDERSNRLPASIFDLALMNFLNGFSRVQTSKIFITSMLIAVSSWCLAEERLITNDGREVILHEDGTWEFASEDRYAITPAGQQVQLKADGSWTVVESASTASVGQQVIGVDTRPSLVGVELNEAFVEEYSERAGAQSKNTRNFRYINFLLDVSLSAEAENALSLNNLDPNQFSVTDDRGGDYDILSLESTNPSLQPGQSSQIRVITDGAPGTLVRVSDIVLNISPNTLGTDSAFELEVNYRGLDRKNISRKY